MGLIEQTPELPATAVPATEPLRQVCPSTKAKKKFSESFRHGQVRLRKRVDSGIWHAVYKHPMTHKVIEVSTSTNRKDEALKYAQTWSIQLTNGKLGIADGSMELGLLFEQYNRAMGETLARETVKRVTSSWHVFERWLPSKGRNVIKHITRTVVEDFRKHRIDGGTAKRTVDNDIINLHTVFRWGERAGFVPKSPFNYTRAGLIKLYKEPSPRPDTYSDEEYALLVKAADEAGDTLIRDMIVVFADTGMRFGELTHLTSESLEWQMTVPRIDIRARNGWKPKDPWEQKQIPMTENVQEVLRRREAEAKGGYLFANEAGNPMDENASRKRLKKLFPAAGIDSSRRLHWHSWRNHFVQRALRYGMSVPEVMLYTGHDSFEMVMRYANALDKTPLLAAAFAKFRPRGEKSGKSALNDL